MSATLTHLDGRDLAFTDGSRLRLPEQVNAVECCGVAGQWKLTVPGRTGNYDRGALLYVGETQRGCVAVVEYLRRCVRQELVEAA